MLFFSTTAHKRSPQQWSNNQNFLLLRYSAHLSLDVHCSSHLIKKKKIYIYIYILTSLSSFVKKTISYSLSLSLRLLLLSSFFLKIFFFLSSSPASSLVSLIPQLAGQLPNRLSVPPSSPTRPKLPLLPHPSARRFVQPTRRPNSHLNDFDLSLRRP